MSLGKVYQFIDYSTGTGGDTGEAYDAGSVLPLLNGQDLDQSNIGRAPENIRQRTEAVRSVFADVLYMLDADRNGLCLNGPGLVTWGGSTTTAGTGIVTLTDNLYLMPFLTPGQNQTPPIPPVASKLGTLTLEKADTSAGITVTSALRSYFAGHMISVTVVSGAVYGIQLLDNYRTIIITATAATTLSQVITDLNALTTTIPSATAVVTAVLAGGAVGSDLLLRPQAKQFVSGNVDAEAHTITPAALTSFFATVGNRLAEGDTLCIAYAANAFSPSDPTPLGGRRQSIPENSNTTIPSGSLFNSRVAPESLVNALPICKVVGGKLVFVNGTALLSGAAGASLGGGGIATNTQLGVVELTYAAGTPTAPKVAPQDAAGTISNTGTTGPGFSGTGGTNSTGLVGQGTGTGSGGDFTGGATGSAVVTHGVASNDKPQALRKDSAGNVRSLVDHNGYRMGRTTPFREYWQNKTATLTATADPVVNNPKWKSFFDAGNNGSIVPTNPSASYPSRFLALNSGTGTTNKAMSIFTTAPVINASATFLSAVFEAEVAFDALTGSTGFFIGFVSDTTDPSVSTDYVWFTWFSGLGNWLIQTSAASVQTGHNASVGPVAAAYPSQRLRIELHGSTSPFGATTARFFINGVPETAITTHFPTGALNIAVGTTKIGAGASNIAYVGPIECEWNRALSLDAL